MNADAAYHEIVRVLRSLGLRLRLQSTARWVPRAAAAGLTLGLLLALAGRLWPLITRWQAAALSSALAWAAVLIAALAVWLRRRPLTAVARTLDLRLGLGERLSTAVELWTGRIDAPPALAFAQLDDARLAATRISGRRALPVRLDRREMLLVLVLLAGLVVTLALPNAQEEILAERAAVQAAIEQQVQALEALKQQVEANPNLTPGDRDALLQQLSETQQRLAEAKTREEALAEMSEAAQRFQEMQSAESGRQADDLRQAGEQMRESSATEPAQALGDALAAGDYAQAAGVLDALSQKGPNELSAAEQAELAEQLREAAGALQDTNPALAERLADAADALDQGGLDAARDELANAADAMGDAGSAIAASEAAAAAAQTTQQGRDAVAAAGETQSGQPADGGAQQGSTGSGQQGTGDAQQGTGGGQPGQTGQQGNGNAQGGTQGGQSGHHEDTGTSRDEVYAPDRVGGGENVPLPDDGQNPDGTPAGQGQANPGQSTVPYSDVYRSYAEAAGAALDSDYIPLGYKSYIRDYFASLDPER